MTFRLKYWKVTSILSSDVSCTFLEQNLWSKYWCVLFWSPGIKITTLKLIDKIMVIKNFNCIIITFRDFLGFYLSKPNIQKYIFMNDTWYEYNYLTIYRIIIVPIIVPVIYSIIRWKHRFWKWWHLAIRGRWRWGHRWWRRAIGNLKI